MVAWFERWPECVNIAAYRNLLSSQLLRRHVGGITSRICAWSSCPARAARPKSVINTCPAVDHNVGGFEVAMEHALVVPSCESSTKLAGDFRRFVAGQASDAAQQGAESTHSIEKAGVRCEPRHESERAVVGSSRWLREGTSARLAGSASNRWRGKLRKCRPGRGVQECGSAPGARCRQGIGLRPGNRTERVCWVAASQPWAPRMPILAARRKPNKSGSVPEFRRSKTGTGPLRLTLSPV